MFKNNAEQQTYNRVLNELDEEGRNFVKELMETRLKLRKMLSMYINPDFELPANTQSQKKNEKIKIVSADSNIKPVLSAKQSVKPFKSATKKLYPEIPSPKFEVTHTPTSSQDPDQKAEQKVKQRKGLRKKSKGEEEEEEEERREEKAEGKAWRRLPTTPSPGIKRKSSKRGKEIDEVIDNMEEVLADNNRESIRNVIQLEKLSKQHITSIYNDIKKAIEEGKEKQKTKNINKFISYKKHVKNIALEAEERGKATLASFGFKEGIRCVVPRCGYPATSYAEIKQHEIAAHGSELATRNEWIVLFEEEIKDLKRIANNEWHKEKF